MREPTDSECLKIANVANKAARVAARASDVREVRNVFDQSVAHDSEWATCVRAEWQRIQTETAPLSDAEVLRLARIGTASYGGSEPFTASTWRSIVEIVVGGGRLDGESNVGGPDAKFATAVRAAIGHKEAVIGTANVVIDGKPFKRVGEIVYDTRPMPVVPASVVTACEQVRAFLALDALSRLPLSDVRQAAQLQHRLREPSVALLREVAGFVGGVQCEPGLHANQRRIANLCMEAK